jgi:uncharacterized protein YjiS (DUF1127 family)
METTMTTLDHSDCKTNQSSFDFPSLARKVLRVGYRAMKMRGERAALHAMPDHLLKDLGISRSEIEHLTSMRYPSNLEVTPDTGNTR